MSGSFFSECFFRTNHSGSCSTRAVAQNHCLFKTVAEAGVEPTMFRLWAWWVTNYSIPRCPFFYQSIPFLKQENYYITTNNVVRHCLTNYQLATQRYNNEFFNVVACSKLQKLQNGGPLLEQKNTIVVVLFFLWCCSSFLQASKQKNESCWRKESTIFKKNSSKTASVVR